MTEPKKEEAKTEDKSGETTKITMGSLKELIRDTITEVVGKTSTPSEPKSDDKPEGKSLASEVQAAIDRIRSKEAADKKDADEKKSITDQIAELKEKTKEKEPVQRGKLHKFMGWGDQ